MANDSVARVTAVLLGYLDQAGVGRHEHGGDPSTIRTVRTSRYLTPIVRLDGRQLLVCIAGTPEELVPLTVVHTP